MYSLKKSKSEKPLFKASNNSNALLEIHPGEDLALKRLEAKNWKELDVVNYNEKKVPVFVASTAPHASYYEARAPKSLNPIKRASAALAKLEHKPNFRNYAKTHFKTTDSGTASVFAITSFALSLVALVNGSLLIGLISIIFGTVALLGFRKNPDQPGKGLAIAGLVLGIIVLSLIILSTMFLM